jgi:3-hydroxyisobutyrate dehydrogenase-like beta-hydroxyacid dehydrogenase
VKTGVIDGSVHAPDIGFIGLGIMGEPMAGHLAAAGYRISVHDIDRSRCESVARNKPRIQVCDSPQEVAASAEIVICMLPSGKYVREVALGERGLIHGFRPGSILLDTSSC